MADRDRVPGIGGVLLRAVALLTVWAGPVVGVLVGLFRAGGA